jgi:probable F420-dependent oxidoreductase
MGSDGTFAVGVNCFANPFTIQPAELARTLEERGFDSLWVPEHTHIPVEERCSPHPFARTTPTGYRDLYDPFVILSQAMSVTRRLRVGTGICLIAQRDPIVLAKEVATLDYLSGGRFNFGVGFGWNKAEGTDHGMEWDRRRELVLDRIRFARTFWSSEAVIQYDGDFMQLLPSWAGPKPIQPSGPPVYIGGLGGPANLRAVAEVADGWLALRADDIEAKMRQLAELTVEFERDPSTMRTWAYLSVDQVPDVERLRDAGLSGVVISLGGPTHDDAHRKLDACCVELDKVGMLAPLP